MSIFSRKMINAAEQGDNGQFIVLHFFERRFCNRGISLNIACNDLFLPPLFSYPLADGYLKISIPD